MWMARAEVGLGNVVAFVCPVLFLGGGVLVRIDARLTKDGLESGKVN